MRWILTFSLAVAMAGSAYAQQEVKTPQVKLDQYAERMTQQMTQQLGLAPEQVEKIREVNAKFMTEAMQDRSGEAGPAKDKAALEAEHNEGLKSVLTEDQYRKWTEIQAARTARTPDGQPIQSVTPVK